MRRQHRTLGIFVAATLLVAGCGDNENIILDNDNTNSRTPTPVLTSTAPGQTATQVPAATPTPEEIETPLPSGSTPTPVGPTPVATETVVAATLTPTPEPTAAAASCGNGTKETGEECDTGPNFAASNADCATQCTCCICRPAFHSVPGPKCGTCHPSIAPALTYPPGAAETFPGLCE